MNDLLKKYDQAHLLKFNDELSAEEQKHLMDQINSIDFDLVKSLYEGVGKKKEIASISDMPSFGTHQRYVDLGLESFKNGEYAVVTMAGGQGTRLGYDGPKGTYLLEYGINKSLFEIQCDKLKHIYNMSGVYPTWYIMTSYQNDLATREFFLSNNYFDYPNDKIFFFPQKELPMIDSHGLVLMDSKFNIKMGANGSGGVFSALVEHGMLKKMKEDHVKWIFIGGIDNILLPIDNPDLIGFAKEKHFLVASKIVSKAYPDEKVGVFCRVNGLPSVIEYMDMTNEMNHRTYEDGKLVFGDAHILCNLFNLDILEDIAKNNLPYSGAFKKTNYLDNLGNLITSEVPNAYKFETFIFDAFSYVEDMGLLTDQREHIFAPIKNALGNDSPLTASELYLNFYKGAK